MIDLLDGLNQKLKAMKMMNIILSTWTEMKHLMSEADNTRYLLMLETAKFFMLRNNFARVIREYESTIYLLDSIRSDQKNSA